MHNFVNVKTIFFLILLGVNVWCIEFTYKNICSYESKFNFWKFGVWTFVVVTLRSITKTGGVTNNYRLTTNYKLESVPKTFFSIGTCHIHYSVVFVLFEMFSKKVFLYVFVKSLLHHHSLRLLETNINLTK